MKCHAYRLRDNGNVGSQYIEIEGARRNAIIKNRALRENTSQQGEREGTLWMYPVSNAEVEVKYVLPFRCQCGRLQEMT